MADYDKIAPMWNENMHYFRKCVGLKEFGFDIKENEAFYDDSVLSLFKTNQEYIHNISVVFDQNELYAHNFFLNLSIQELENNFNENITNDLKYNKWNYTFNLGALLKRDQYANFYKSESARLRKEISDDQTLIQSVVQILKKDCIETFIPLLEEWTNLDKIYHEIIYPICAEKKTIAGTKFITDFIGGRDSDIKVMYIMHLYNYPYIREYIDQQIYFARLYGKEYDITTEAKQEYFDLRIKNLISYITKIGIDYDFTKVKYEE